MPEELPDDVSLWPSDPFELLGVPRTASEKDVKRAYTRLIRRFKPEHHPEQFRRVRDAYESAVEQLKWFGFERQYLQSEPPTEPPADEPPAVSRPVEVAAFVDEAKGPWEAAIEGRDAEAYAALAELAAARPERPDLPLRLYWLLGLNPDLDGERTRHDWLADALRRSNLGGPAAELYRRELRADAETALGGVYAEVLTLPAPAANRLMLAHWRQHAAGAAGLWLPLDRDLEFARGHSIRDDEFGWLRFVAGAFDLAAWERNEPTYTRCRDELEQLKHLGLSHAEVFDRVDELEQLAAQWRAARDNQSLPVKLLRAVRAGWSLPYEDWWPHVEAAEVVAGDPTRMLVRFDRVLESPAAPLLMLFEQLLAQHARYTDRGGAEQSASAVRALVWEFTSRFDRVNYAAFRGPLLEFLDTEVIYPQELVAACEEGSGLRDVASMVCGDWSLRCVWLAKHVLAG